MRLSFLSALFFCAQAFPLAAANSASSEPEGGVCFRFDDNQSPERWRSMASVFEAHDARLCMSLNLYSANSPDFLQTVKALQDRGHELMDHTPTHAVFSMRCPDAKTAGSFASKPFVDHVAGSTVFFKFVVDSSLALASFSANVDGKAVEIPDSARKAAEANFQLLDSETGKVFTLFKTPSGSLELRSFWNEDCVDLGKGTRSFVVLDRMHAFSAAPGVLEFQTGLVRTVCRENALANPTAWIQPGSFEPVLRAPQLRDELGPLGYVAGATYPERAEKCFGEPNPSGERQYAMMWGDFSLESQSVEEAKRVITSKVARHYLPIASSHMVVKSVPGGWDGYLKKHDELLAWCSSSGIPVRTMSEAARLLYSGKRAPSAEAMPSLAVDRDADGVPDGFELGKGVVAELTSASVVSKEAGPLLSVKDLAGLRPGVAKFSFKAQGQAGTEISASFRFKLEGYSRAIPAELRNWKLSGSETETQSCEISVPENAFAVDVLLSRKGQGELRVSELSLKAE